VSRKKRRKLATDSIAKPSQQQQAEPNADSWKFSLVALVVICVLGTVIYSNSYDAPFVFDDENNIVQNQKIRITELNLGTMYDTVVAGMHEPRPVAYLSFAINYYFGEYDLPGYHLVNLIIHLINGILVYFLASLTYRLLLGGCRGKLDDSNRETVGWLSLFAACLFVAHPLQTQAVTYIVQRMTSLAALFFILSLLLYVLGRLNKVKRNQWLLWAGACVAFVLSLGSKQIAITLPVIILLYEWYFFRDLDKPWAQRGMKYLVVLAIGLGAISLLFLGTSPWQVLVDGYDIRDFTMGERVLTQFRVVMMYFGLILLPLPSRLNLNHYISTSHSFFDPITTLFSMLAIFGILGLSLYLARRQRLLSFCILWFFINLVLESSIVALEMIFEHRVYLPLFGVVLLVPYLLHQMLAKIPRFEMVVAVLLVLSLGRGSYLRNEVWNDATKLWTDVITKNPHSHRAYDSRGNFRWVAGQYNLAIADFSKSIELKPDYAIAYNNRANSYAEQKKYALALKDYSNAVRYDPDYVAAYANRGSLYGETRKYDLALADYKKSLELAPTYAPAYFNRSVVYSLLGNYESAVADISKAIELNPNVPDLHSKRALYYRKLFNFNAAIEDYQKVVELQPEALSDIRNLGWLLATAPNEEDRDGKLAMEYANHACELTQWKNTECLQVLAAAYAETGDFLEAVQWQSKALELAPQSRKPTARQRLELYLRKQPYRLATD
jgi:tetratricopeptide (TPR) repeat protein